LDTEGNAPGGAQRCGVSTAGINHHVVVLSGLALHLGTQHRTVVILDAGQPRRSGGFRSDGNGHQRRSLPIAVHHQHIMPG
jgi:hypothetical protein